MPNGDPRDGFFLSYPHTVDRFFFIILQGGFTALYLAAQEGNKDVVSMLLRAGASEKIVNSVSFSNTFRLQFYTLITVEFKTLYSRSVYSADYTIFNKDQHRRKYTKHNTCSYI